MPTNNAGFQVEQAGQPVTTPGATPQVDSTGTPQQATPDADVIAAAEAIRRKRQSESDREAAEIARAYKEWKSKGNTGTVEQMLQGSSEIQSQPGQPIQEGAAAQAVSPTGEAPDLVVQKAMFIMEEYAGEMIPEDAPEQAMINKDTNDPAAFLESIRVASKAYAERTKNLSNPARIPSLAGGAVAHVPSHAKKSGTETLDDFFESLDL